MIETCFGMRNPQASGQIQSYPCLTCWARIRVDVEWIRPCTVIWCLTENWISCAIFVTETLLSRIPLRRLLITLLCFVVIRNGDRVRRNKWKCSPVCDEPICFQELPLSADLRNRSQKYSWTVYCSFIKSLIKKCRVLSVWLTSEQWYNP